MQTAAIEAVDPRHAGVASGLFSTGRYAGSIVAALLLAALLGDGGAHAGAFFAITAAAAGASALLALRLDGDGPGDSGLRRDVSIRLHSGRTGAGGVRGSAGRWRVSASPRH